MTIPFSRALVATVTRGSVVSLLLLLVASSWAPAAHAAVSEPNGIQVPCAIPCVANPDPNYSETSLQSFFAAQGEPLDALADANTEPGVFQPLCNFKATLVLSQSNANCGIAWYNVPADASATPTALYPIIPVTATGGGMVGQEISSADIVSNPNYLKGFIGFALTKYLGSDDTPVYYSEYQRNRNCTGCTAGSLGPTGLPQTPGYWKMALVYPSTVTPNAYYLAFEDWEGANDTTWFGNDGDFNDKVFKIEGVTCTGGGQPCETSGQGACKAGLTECGLGGALVCKAQVSPSPERCDNFDNDCNGVVDDGKDLCPDPSAPICLQGSCVGDCNRGEFQCGPGLVCDAASHCVDPTCAGISCPAGQACRKGQCSATCDQVTCPLGQACDPGNGRCVAPCDGVSCPSDQVCEHGVCVASCTCRQCPTSDECDKASGQCVATGCAGVTCAANMLCSDGACVDPCAAAVCPGGAACVMGHCGEPLVDVGGSSGIGVGGGLNFNLAGASSVVGTSNGVGTAGGSDVRSSSHGSPSKAGCGCRVEVSRATGDRLAILGFGLLGVLAARSRRRRAA